MSDTNARRKVLWLIFFLAVITYFDRVCISAAAPAITAEFHLSPEQMGYVFGAFSLAYALFEIPGGWLGDRFGTRRALARIVLCWTAFTMITGAATGFLTLVIIRFCFGAGEAGAFPNIARTVSNWLPVSEQGKGISIAFLGVAAGAAISAPLVIPIVGLFGWRWTFVIVGLAGVIWTIVWYWWFRDKPEDHSGVGREELELIKSGKREVGAGEADWRKLITNRNMLSIGIAYFAFGYGIFFYVTWLPTYLIKARGFAPEHAKWLSAVPWIFSGAAFVFGGWLTDRLARTNLKLARCGVGAIGYTISGLALVAVALTPSSIAAALLLAVAACFQMMTLAASWSVCLDVGRSRVGVVSGFMNMVGNVGGTLSPIAVGVAVQRFGSWSLPFYFAAGVFAFGALMWLTVDPLKPVLAEA